MTISYPLVYKCKHAQKDINIQARSQKILLGSAFEEKVDFLILQYSPGAVENFIIVWCMLRAHIHEGLY